MEFILKGTHLLKWMQKDAIEAIEHATFLMWQKSRLSFRILKVSEKDVTIGITQANFPDGKYYTQKELIGIVHEIMDRFFAGKRIIVHASPYKESPALKVDPSWIKKKMDSTGIKLKQISADTGMNYTHLSALIGGKKPLTDAMKALFYFYFQSQDKS